MTAMALRFQALLSKWMPAARSLGIRLPWLTPATRQLAPNDPGASVVRFSLLGGMAVAETILAALMFLNSPVKSGATPHTPVRCQPYVELRGVEADARDIGKPQAWVAENYKVNLWSSLANDRWETGHLEPSERAVIVGRNQYGYKVKTADGAEGWVSNFHVSRTLSQDADTLRPCD